MRKFISILLTVAILLGTVAIPVFATESTYTPDYDTDTPVVIIHGMSQNDTYMLEINSNATEIFFYTGYGGYKKVLQKDKESNEWILINN